MKAYSKLLFIFLCIFSLTLSVSADSCSNATKKDLAQKATYIKANYEIVDESEIKDLEIEGNKTTYKIPNYYFKITIYNVKDGLKVDVSNTGNDHKFTITSSDANSDGNYTFEDYDFGNIYNYEFVVKSNGSECSNITLKTVRFTKPRYNAYSEFAYCQNSSNFYCQKFVGTETNIKSTDEFLKKIKANQKTDVSTSDEDDIKSELKNNWIAYVIAVIFVVVFVGGGIIAFVLYKKKKESVL